MMGMSEIRFWLLTTFVLLSGVFSGAAFSQSAEVHPILVHYDEHQIESKKLAFKIKASLSLKDGLVLPIGDTASFSRKASRVVVISDTLVPRLLEAYDNTPLIYISWTKNLDHQWNKLHRPVLLYPPIADFFDYIRKLKPSGAKVMMYYSEPINKGRLQTKAKEYNIQLRFVRVKNKRNLGKALSKLRGHDFLYVQRDRKLYNQKTIRNVVLSSYNMRVPIISYSKKLTQAGALGAVYFATSDLIDLLEEFKDGSSYETAFQEVKSFKPQTITNKRLAKTFHLGVER